jgi:hypothetical protein
VAKPLAEPLANQSRATVKKRTGGTRPKKQSLMFTITSRGKMGSKPRNRPKEKDQTKERSSEEIPLR